VAENTTPAPDMSASASSSAAATPAPAAQPPAAPPAVYATFDDWKQNFIEKARSRGFDPAFVAQVFDGVQPQATVTASDSQQPEFSKPISSYIRQAVSPTRSAAARTALDGNTNVSEIVTTYGVPQCLLGGVWSMESDLGRVQGNIDVVSALATLAYNGRRRVWAEDQLIATLTILRDHGISRETLKGSWAGAMGNSCRTATCPWASTVITTARSISGTPIPTPWPRPATSWPSRVGSRVRSGRSKSSCRQVSTIIWPRRRN
jgi:membrane-bound lytic murein transglycosylase B